ncbi:uncharacterized protein VICG_01331 [Vittaforma corneae ATCC 50505]|uniref:Translocation protein SEC62 n=1 Tax=Vittaforma corneae (strain ATCC 50505) TaxID=993615 RepID=L2GL40_VITCO|nr:uncharacterized protein VICG_01331 [Vittaforma corneae ATCC 50505]ELA41583.1 hypothetical protein VICG_01331 [Vittaforma corneae ATCC 50505]
MAINTEKILRGIDTEEKIFRNMKRVNVIKAVDCVVTLSKCGMDTQTIKSEIQKLLEAYKIVRVRLNEKNPNLVDLAISKTVNASDYYMWTEERYDYRALAISMLCVAVVLGLVMYRIWPPWLRVIGKYVQYVILGLLILLLFIAFVRLVVFAITYLIYSSGLWLLPNLFAECGFFESFVPLHSWGDEDVSHKKE